MDLHRSSNQSKNATATIHIEGKLGKESENWARSHFGYLTVPSCGTSVYYIMESGIDEAAQSSA